MVDPNDNDFYEDEEYEEDGIGCANCDGGWHHGCMDDLCRGSTDAEECEDAIPCKLCNPNGEYSA